MKSLVRALGYEDPVIDRGGQRVDLGADVRVAAAEALGRFGGAEAHAGLVRALSDPELTVRISAVRALGQEPEAAATEALTAAAANWSGTELEPARAEAVAALASGDDPACARRLAEALLERRSELDERDAEILRELDGAGEGGTLGAAIEVLVEHLGEPRVEARAVSLLGWLAPESVGPLIDVLGRSSEARAAALGLGRARDSRAVERLCELLRAGGDPGIRRAAAWALGEIKDPAAAETLLVATGDSDYGVREEAGRGFDKLGNVAVAVTLGAIVRHALQTGTPVGPVEVLAGLPEPPDRQRSQHPQLERQAEGRPQRGWRRRLGIAFKP